MSSKISIIEKLSLVAIEKLTTAGTAWNKNRKGQLFRSKKKGSNFRGGPRVRIGKRRVERVHLSSRSPSPRCAHRLFFSPLRWYPACIETNRKETVRYVRAAPQKKVKRRKKKKKKHKKRNKKEKGRKKREAGREDPVHRWRIFAPKAAWAADWRATTRARMSLAWSSNGDKLLSPLVLSSPSRFRPCRASLSSRNAPEPSTGLTTSVRVFGRSRFRANGSFMRLLSSYTLVRGSSTTFSFEKTTGQWRQYHQYLRYRFYVDAYEPFKGESDLLFWKFQIFPNY